MSLLNSKATHRRSLEAHHLSAGLLLLSRCVRCPRELLSCVQSERVIEHDGLTQITNRTRLRVPEVDSLRLDRSSHRAHVTKLLHIGRYLQHRVLHGGVLLVHWRIRVQNVLVGSHEPTRGNGRRCAERGGLHHLRLLDGSTSCRRRSLHLARFALRKGHVLR